MNAPDALAKLATKGDLGHIVTYLAALGIRGQCGNPNSCLLAEYLAAQGCGEVSVHPNNEGLAGIVLSGHEVYQLPAVLNDLANSFDRGAYPELELRWEPE